MAFETTKPSFRTTVAHQQGLAEASRQLDAKLANRSVTEVAGTIANARSIDKKTAANETTIRNTAGHSSDSAVKNSYFGNSK